MSSTTLTYNYWRRRRLEVTKPHDLLLTQPF